MTIGIMDYLFHHPLGEKMGKTLYENLECLPQFCAERGIDLEARCEMKEADGIEVLQIWLFLAACGGE